MQTAVDLQPEAYQRAQQVATQLHKSVAEVVSETILERFGQPESREPKVEVGPNGFPALYVGRKITSEEIREINEGMEIENETAPAFIIDEYGWPVVSSGRPLTLEETKALIEED